MKTYTEEELFDWMAEQPDDRPVNMMTGSFEIGCGCLLTQFFKSKGEVGEHAFTNGSLSPGCWSIKTVVALSKGNIFRYFTRSNLATFAELKKNFLGVK